MFMSPFYLSLLANRSPMTYCPVHLFIGFFISNTECFSFVNATINKSIMELQEWKFIQSNADQILIGGLNNLNEQKYLHGMDFTISRPGNYLISLDDKPVYIGEGKILSNRIKQQFNPKTSTFYKNYLRSDSKANFPIDSFSIKAMETKNWGKKKKKKRGGLKKKKKKKK